MHRSNMRKRFFPFLVVFVALTAIMMTVAFAEGEAEYVSNFYASPLSLLPPVIAIILALITKEVYSSLFVGILFGGCLFTRGIERMEGLELLLVLCVHISPVHRRDNARLFTARLAIPLAMIQLPC